VREPFRLVGHKLAFIPGTNVYYGMEDARGYEAVTYWPLGQTYPLWSEHQIVWFNRIDDLTRPFLSFLNIRYAITTDPEPVPEGWRKIAGQRGSSLIENTRVIERAFVPRVVRVGDPVETSLAAMQQQRDFREKAWITADVSAPYEKSNGPGRVTIVKRRLGGEYWLDADMQGDGWVVISDSAWKGWRAYIDGRRVQTQNANIGFVSVYVPRGKHQVRVVYWPESFVIGRGISGLTLFGLIAFAAWRAMRHKFGILSRRGGLR
jgi:hypothetical protein